MNLKKIAYRVLDIATLGKGVKKNISGFNARLPIRYSKYFPSDYEKDNFDFLRQQLKANDIVIDIGAHIGLFAIRAAQLIGGNGKVYAFEPAPQTLKLLQKTIKINHLEKIIVPKAEAIADKDGITYFNVSNIEADNANSLVEYRKDKNLHQVEVKIVSLDNFVYTEAIRRVDFLKIDAEGYEYGVLKGAIKTLSEFKPKCILSLHPNGIIANGNSLEDIWSLVNQLNYTVTYHGREMGKDVFCTEKGLFDVHLMPSI